MPAPPCSSGTATPVRPSSPAWSKKERGNSPDSSISLARGRTTSSANLRTVGPRKQLLLFGELDSHGFPL